MEGETTASRYENSTTCSFTHPCLFTKQQELSGLLGSIHLKNTALLVITEAWFRPGTSDVQVAVTGFTIHRADRTTQSGKARGWWYRNLYQR